MGDVSIKGCFIEGGGGMDVDVSRGRVPNDEFFAIIAQENLWFTEPRRGGINYFLDGEFLLPFEPLLGLRALLSGLLLRCA